MSDDDIKVVRAGRRRQAETPPSQRERAEAPRRERESAQPRPSGSGYSGTTGRTGSTPRPAAGLPVGS